MRRARPSLFGLAFALALSWPLATRAEQKPRPADKDKQAPARTFTDADLERYKREREAQAAPKEGESAPAAEAGADPGVPSGGEGGESHLAMLEVTRRAFEEARQARDAARARVEAIERQLNPMSADYEGDLERTLRLREELPDARAALEASEASLATAQAAFEAAERDARRVGARLPQG